MRGASMRVLWIAPQGCVYYPVYEAVQSLTVQSLQPREAGLRLRRMVDGQLARLPVALRAAVPGVIPGEGWFQR